VRVALDTEGVTGADGKRVALELVDAVPPDPLAAPNGKEYGAVGNYLFQAAREPTGGGGASSQDGCLDAGPDKSRGYCLEMIRADFLAAPLLWRRNSSEKTNTLKLFQHSGQTGLRSEGLELGSAKTPSDLNGSRIVRAAPSGDPEARWVALPELRIHDQPRCPSHEVEK
jgi:hypothetical protein